MVNVIYQQNSKCNIPGRQMACPHLRATETHWSRYDVSIGSWLASYIQFPNSEMNSLNCSLSQLQAPLDSKATATEAWVFVMVDFILLAIAAHRGVSWRGRGENAPLICRKKKFIWGKWWKIEIFCYLLSHWFLEGKKWSWKKCKKIEIFGSSTSHIKKNEDFRTDYCDAQYFKMGEITI